MTSSPDASALEDGTGRVRQAFPPNGPRSILGAGATVVFLLCVPLRADQPTVFFETRVRPVLANSCWNCHGPQAQQGGLRLDSREAALAGGGRGPAIAPGDPDSSLLMQALRHEGLQMPMGGRLEASQIADFEEWIRNGAAWPEAAGSAIRRAAEGPGESIHWAFRPVRAPDAPDVEAAAWLTNEVDAFVLARLEAEGLRPAAQAGPRPLIRRLAFDITGLPPRPEEVEAFVRDNSAASYRELVDRLLDSERFGEHWARHWMDWVRYCESHGSQGDFELPMAWRYRDYLIRAFNEDVPYDQLVREYIAGDLLESPRINAKEGLNESMHGPGNFRMVEYGYVPVDALGDQVKVVENQIDVLSKAFQGLTVACARCHDHKFDPIAQADFYALYGVLASSRPGMVTVDSPESLASGRDRLAELRRRIRSSLAEAWTTDGAGLAPLLASAGAALDQDPDSTAGAQASDEADPRLQALQSRLASEELAEDDPLRVWLELRVPDDSQAFQDRWRALREEWRGKAEQARSFNQQAFRPMWDLSSASDARTWFASGPGVPAGPSDSGEFRIEPEGQRVVLGLLPAGIHTGLDSQKYGGILGSPRFRIPSDYISIRASGGNFAAAKVIVENYPIGDGGIHPAKDLAGDRFEWVRFDTSYRKGQMAYIELQTLGDRSRPFRDSKTDPDRVSKKDGRSNFGIAEVVFHDEEETPRAEHRAILHLLEREPPRTLADLEQLYDELVRDAAQAWDARGLDRGQAAFLDSFVGPGLLPATIDDLTGMRSLIEEYRAADEAVPVPRRAPGVLPGTSFDQPLFLQGDHEKPVEPVERGYLGQLGGEPFRTEDSGRLELARAIASESNPLTARVLVNRLWHLLFGRGLVSSVDNFGTAGERPSHPELLDSLAARFVDEGWSIKGMIRYIVTSSTYRMSTQASAAARAQDPRNRLLQHQSARRLSAESIRDAVLETSGDLDRAMYGPSIDVYYVGKTEGGGPKGPLDGARRRSVYQAVRRNAQNPFLEVFDAPKPSTTRGRRDATNIPAQSLAMLNDPFVVGQASRWADRTLADGAISAKDRAVRMFRRALGRTPDAEETDLLMSSLAAFATERDLEDSEWLGDRGLWKDLAQSLFNLKQFIYLR